MSTVAAGRGPRLVHHALIYRGDAEFLAATTAFCLDGLAAGEKVLAVTGAANIGLLAGALGSAAAGVEFVEAGDWYDAPGRTLAAYARYVDTHKNWHGRIRVIGEPVWHGRTALEEAEWTRYESVINAAFAAQPAWILCPYDARTLPARIVADARRTHPRLQTGEGTRVSDAYVDPDAFTCASDLLPLPPPPADATEIGFDDDLHGMRRLVSAAARRLGLPDHRIERLLLAVNEVAANAVEHGAGHGRILMWADGTFVVCEVADPGRLEARLPGYLPPEPTAERGHGLWVARQLCELLEIRSDPAGTRIRLHLART
ncbi:sensor histidine kinase [Nonomuraea sp. SYSU D8015]|uniref:sensor histidine kinase n=1 Tax=Nonomuraea sp. SYSU D8015 TaxID=2593644 RepID=UPI001660FDCF|nr:sensor histidine kinase [Nonomuraea sp. SYSU D8015]